MNWKFGSFNRARRERFMKSFQEELDEVAGHRYLSREDLLGLESFNNKATQLLDKQTQMVQTLLKRT